MSGHNAFYAQSGGVTAVINATACGVIEAARRHSDRIGTLFAGRDGILGALNENLIDTSQEYDEAIAALRHTPAGAFGSARYKLKTINENRAEYERLVEVFRAHDIGYFFYNGGGDSQDTAYKVSQMGDAMGFPITAIGIPKTVDNDAYRHLPRLRFRGQVHRGVRARGRARRRLHGDHLDPGIHPRGHGPQCRLDRRRGRPGQATGQTQRSSALDLPSRSGFPRG